MGALILLDRHQRTGASEKSFNADAGVNITENEGVESAY